jgi:A/G-specific adenine glycosylase
MTFTATILDWFRENGRSLPWREHPDAYAVWLSEIILQQTRIEQGQPYWERFMQRWPTVEALAAATEDEVLREWQGLGYYSRARNLHTAARQVVGQGGFPQTLEGLRALKGVGDYTAAAIGSIAFGLPAAVVDGNVYRVLARHYGISTPINTTEGKKEFAVLAQQLLPKNQSSAFNQAMMDFGATQCTPQSPRCTDCPLSDSCVALHEGRVGQLPVKLRTLKVKERRLTYVYIRWNGQTALHRRPEGDIWQGLYEPWLTEQVPGGAILLQQGVKHVLTHRVIYADFWLWETDVKPSLPDGYKWVAEDDTDRYAQPRLIEKLMEEVKKYTEKALSMGKND